MPKIKFLRILVLIALLLMSSGFTLAQPRPENWVYALSESETAYQLVRVDSASGSVEPVFAIDNIASRPFRDIAPEDEIRIVAPFLQWAQLDNWLPADSILNRHPDVSIESVVVSPDTQEAALQIRYGECYPQFQNTCFGTTQIILISGADSPPRKLFEIGFHSNRYFAYASGWEFDVTIQEIRWTPDQAALVIGIINDSLARYPYSGIPLIVVPIDNQRASFLVGKTGGSWGLNPNSREIATIMVDCTSDCIERLNLIDFDLLTGPFSEVSYSLWPYMTAPFFNLVYLDQSIVFYIAFDTRLQEGGGGLAVFNPSQAPNLSLTPIDKPYMFIRASLDGKMAYIQTDDGKLWRVTLDHGTLETVPFISDGLAYWQIGPDHNLLVRSFGDANYQIVNSDGVSVGQLSPIQMLELGSALHCVTWGQVTEHYVCQHTVPIYLPSKPTPSVPMVERLATTLET
jgi:hypothetical protein